MLSLKNMTLWFSTLLSIMLFFSVCVVPFDSYAQQGKKRTRNKTIVAASTDSPPQNMGMPFDESIAAAIINNFTHKIDNSNEVDLLAVKNYYRELNEEGQQNMRTFCSCSINDLLEKEQKALAINWINVYKSIVSNDDEELPAMLYVEGTIYTEQLDSTNLKVVISELEELPSTPWTQNYISLLEENLKNVYSYQTPYKAIEGIWVADGLSWTIVDKKGSTVNCVGTNDDRFLDVFMSVSYDSWADTLSLTLQRTSQVVDDIRVNQKGLSITSDINDLHSIVCVPTEGDSLYVLWSSERLFKGNFALASSIRNSTGQIAAEINAHYSQRNEYNWGQSLLGGFAALGIDMVSNALVSAFTEPHKRMFLLEGKFKIENDLHLSGKFRYRFYDVSAGGSVDYIELESDDFDFVKWIPEGNFTFFDFKHGVSKCLYIHPQCGMTEKEYMSTPQYELCRKFNNLGWGPYIWSRNQFKLLTLYADSVLNSRGETSNLLKYKKPYLGVNFIDVPDKIHNKQKQKTSGGVLIKKIERFGAASFYGLKKNDVILSVNGSGVYSAEHFQDILSNMVVGDWLLCEVLRKKEIIKIPIRLTFDTSFKKLKK